MIDFHKKVPNILVIGDLMIDHYLWGSCDRISPEAPVQIVKIDNESVSLGGAGNVINNLRALGAKVDVLSVLGECNVADDLKALLHNIGVGTNYLVSQPDRISSKKSRIIASQQQVVRFDSDSNNEINIKSQNLLLKTFEKIITNYDIVIFSDYGKGVLSSKLTQSLIKVSNLNNIKVLVDPKGNDYSKYKGAYLLTPNKKEASEATQIEINSKKTLGEAIKKLKSSLDLKVSIITLSNKGIAIYDDNLRTCPTVAKEVFDVTGAGDTVIASIGLALALNINIDEAVEFANLAAGVVVGKLGSATTTINEIIEYESSLNKSSSAEHIKTVSEITELSAKLKSRDKHIVFTNGCFDLIHNGHVKYLETAKSYGDVLIVGLNSDLSVTKLKGNDRPINEEADRAYILAALEVVDYVVIFNQDTPYELIKAIKPHILAKGGDYFGQKVVGEDIAEKLILIDFIEGKSTTKTIQKIKKVSK